MSERVFVGLASLDVMHRVEALPGPNQKVTARSQSIAVGGPAANAALTCAALLPGGRTTLVTALGRGPVAQLIRADLGRLGVEVLDATPSAATDPPVSAAAVIASTGERSVVSVDAIAARTPVPAELDALVGRADVVLVDGHHPALALAAARAARRAGVPLVVDAGRWKPVFAQVIDLATDLVCSADLRLPGLAGAEETAVALAGRVPTLVVTHGGDPVRWWAQGRSGAIAVPAVAVLDTLGAGDAFHGAYVAYVDQRDCGLGLEPRLALAIGVATRRCESDGPRAWLAELSSWVP